MWIKHGAHIEAIKVEAVHTHGGSVDPLSVETSQGQVCDPENNRSRMLVLETYACMHAWLADTYSHARAHSPAFSWHQLMDPFLLAQMNSLRSSDAAMLLFFSPRC